MALSTTQYGYIIDPMVPFTDEKGKTIKNGFVRVFVAGSSTPVITYRNFDGAANQDLIELDNSGRTKTSVIGSKGLTYKVCVYDKHHSQESPILTVDKVSVIGSNITAGAGATVVTGLDGLTTKPDGFVDASVIGTDGYVALDHTLVTDDLNTDAKVTAVENDRYVPLLNDDVNDPDSKMTLGRLWQWVLGKIKSLSTTITAFRTGDVIPVDGPSGTAKMGKDDLLKETAENALSEVHCDFVDITWTDGKYINLSNGLSNNGGYSYSDTIQVADGKQLSFKARGYLNYTSIIAEYEFDSDLYITLTQSVGSSGHESDLLTYTWKNKTGETKNIRLSCMITDRPSKVCITPILDDYEISRKISTTRIIGKYISSVGTEVPASGWAHSSVISLGAGERISFNGAGYLGNVSMISEYSNGTYTSLVASVDDNVRTYEYTNSTNTSKGIVLSFDDNSSKRPKEFYIYSKTLNRALESEETAIDGIDSRLSSLENFLDLGLEQKTFTTNSGFITIAGTIGSNGGYRYTSSVIVPSGYTVEIVARGYATNVAMIARELVAGSSYTYLVPSVDDSLRKYSWTNTGDSSENIAFSFSVADAPTFVTLYKDTDDDEKIHLTMSFFESFGALGDSFTAGNLYKGGTSVGTLNHKYSWVSDLSKIIGVEGTNYGVGGATTKSAITHPDQLPKILSDNPLELYIVNFGINEVWNMGSSYIGTSDDIDSDNPDQSSDSFYGNYYRIIKNIQAHAPKAVVVMMFPTTISNTSALKALWNSYYIAAQDIASICGIKFFDTNELLEYSSYTSMQGGHPTITGYATMAIVYKELIERWLQHKDPISLLG